MKQLIVTALAVFICYLGNAQPYIDSFDLNKAKMSNNNPYSSNPTGLLADGTNMYFIANNDTPTVKNQIWLMWGNATEPIKLTNLKDQIVYSFGNSLCKVGNTLFFVAYDATHGQELWYRNHDGGLAIVKDMAEGNLGSAPSNMIRHNNKLIFTAVDTSYHTAIWSYDHNTGQLEQLAKDTLMFSHGSLTIFNNKLCFRAATLKEGSELFEYNFADKTTKLVANINDTSQSSSPNCFTIMGGKLYFTAFTKDFGTELYAYDGTNAPVRLTDLNPGVGSSIAINGDMIEMNGKLYFNGYESNNQFHLMQYDPAANKATLAAKIHPSTGSSITNLTLFRNELYFVSNDGTGLDMWKYDGSTAKRVTNLSSQTFIANINNLAATPHAIYFSARGYSMGIELFRYGMSKVDVENVNFNADVKVYPNPTTNVAHIQMNLEDSKTLNVSVTDINGRVVYSTGNILYSASHHTVDISMHNFAAGTYLYRISNAQGTLMAGGKLQKL